jgi:serine/threonine-protein kinase
MASSRQIVRPPDRSEGSNRQDIVSDNHGAPDPLGATLDATDTPHSRGREILPGTIVGEYVIDTKLGEGGFGCIYRAVHPLLGRVAAVKVLHAQLDSDPETVSRFLAEARAVNRIRHPNIIDVFSFGRTSDDRLYYVMEFLEGESLEAYVARGGMAMGDALLVLRAVARALDAAHDASIVHRDLKPANVFLARDGQGTLHPKLLDFGVAKLAGVDGSMAGAHKTKTGIPIGTPAYMAPEQCRGGEVDARTDIYALGILAFELLTGQRPFHGRGVFDILDAHVHHAPPSPSSVDPRVPTVLDGPILDMLAKDPKDRPERASVAIERLVLAAASVGLSATTTASGLRLEEGTSSLSGPRQAMTPQVPVSKAVSLPEPRKRYGIWLAGALLLLMLLAIAMFRGRKPARNAALAPSTSSLPSPARSSVAVRFAVDPKTARISRNGTHIADAGLVLLPFGQSELVFDVRAPGYEPDKVTLVPDRDQTLSVHLRALPSTPAAGLGSVARPTPSASAAPKPKLHQALENPF